MIIHFYHAERTDRGGFWRDFGGWIPLFNGMEDRDLPRQEQSGNDIGSLPRPVSWPLI